MPVWGSILATSIYIGPLQAQALLARRRSSRGEESKTISGLKCDPVLRFETMEDLLKEIGLEKYFPLFQQRGVEIDKFVEFTDDDLKDLVNLGLCGLSAGLSQGIRSQLERLNSS